MSAALHRSGPMALAMLVASVAGTMAGSQAPSLPGSSSPPAGLIVGRTVDGMTGEAIGGAIVSIILAGPPAGAIRTEDPAPIIPVSTRVISDNNGRFMFHGLAAGNYTVSASKPGYIDGVLGRRFATDTGTQTLALQEGERRGAVALNLWKRATVGGTVLDEAGEPVIGIQVRVLKRAIVGGVVRFTAFGNHPTTDDRGIYRISELTPGDYVVAVVTTQTTMPDSLQAAYAAATKAGDQQEFQRELDRSRGALSSGLGSVASGQRVGSWILQTPLGFGNSGQIAAPPIQAGKVLVYPTVFYPAAASPSTATIVTLGPGEERSTIDFQLRPVVTSRVTGVLTGPNGPETHTSIELIPVGSESLQRDYDFAAALTSTDGAGAFVFLGVAPGTYTLRAVKVPPRPVTTSSMTTVIQTGTTTIMSGGGAAARQPIPDEPTYWASTSVTVGDSDVTDLAITLRTGARLSGRIEFDGVAAKPTADRMGQLRVQISKADARTTSSNEFTLFGGVIDETGNFKTYQLPAGRYVVRGPAFANWAFRGAFVGGRDVSDTPLEVDAEDVGNIVLTYSDRPTEIIGTARRNNAPDDLATIFVFPSQPNLWVNHGPAPRRFKSIRAGANGVFRATSVPAGDYVVIGVHGAFPSEWQDPAFLRKLMALGTATSVVDGEIKTLNLITREIK